MGIIITCMLILILWMSFDFYRRVKFKSVLYTLKTMEEALKTNKRVGIECGIDDLPPRFSVYNIKGRTVCVDGLEFTEIYQELN